MIPFPTKEKYGYQDFLEIIRLLRSPEGCSWDKVQTHQSIRSGLMEEACEVAEAIDNDDPKAMCEELGDLMMQVVFHADIERQAGRFTMDEVCDGVVKKLLFRHPHVFSTTDTANNTADEVLVNWEELKKQEKGYETASQAMDGVAKSLPGLWRAEKIQKRAAAVGFDWKDISGALDKLREEVDELQQAVVAGSNVQEELGDVLFAAVKVGRFAGIDPEAAINGTSDKFVRRFRAMDEEIARKNLSYHQLFLDEWINLWDTAKVSERT